MKEPDAKVYKGEIKPEDAFKLPVSINMKYLIIGYIFLVACAN